MAQHPENLRQNLRHCIGNFHRAGIQGDAYLRMKILFRCQWNFCQGNFLHLFQCGAGRLADLPQPVIVGVL